MIRPFRAEDAIATRDVFVAAVQQGARGRYTPAELLDWLPDPTMPPDWGPWLGRHVTFVAEVKGRVAGFMMLERSGYLNMAFVLPQYMGTGLAASLYAAILDQARLLAPVRLTVLASRYAQGFFTRHGWQPAPDLTDLEGMDPDQHLNPVNRPMALWLP